MKLYIEIENGQPINHPVTEENLLDAYESIPSNWEPFVRKPRPDPIGYQYVSETSTYEKVGQNWTDVWAIRPMTAEERDAKDLELKSKMESILDKRKSAAAQQIATKTDPAEIAEWQQYIDALNSYTFKSYDPISPPLPKSPFQVSKTMP